MRIWSRRVRDPRHHLDEMEALLTNECPTLSMRLRCMKTKRKSAEDNRCLRLKHFEHMGLLSLTSFLPSRVARCRGSP